MYIEYHPSLSLSYLIKKLKGRSSRKLQIESSVLKQRYWVDIFGVLVMAVGVQVILQMKWITNSEHFHKRFN